MTWGSDLPQKATGESTHVDSGGHLLRVTVRSRAIGDNGRVQTIWTLAEWNGEAWVELPYAPERKSNAQHEEERT